MRRVAGEPGESTSAALDPTTITLLVIAKEPMPGRAKTRLAPDLGADGAAALAEAALADTLDAVAAIDGQRRLLALDGASGDWLPEGFEITVQRGEGLGERLAAAFDDAGGPALLVGMDTPQIDTELLRSGCAELAQAGTDAVIGLAEDGGWWALGLRHPDPAVFDGVPMSAEHTGEAQLASLRSLGLTFRELPVLRDVDTIDDAIEVARTVPGSRFAHALEAALLGGEGTQ